MHILLQSRLKEVQIQAAEKMLNDFYNMLPGLYGDTSCTLNFHSLIHVRLWGPLWTHSLFGFESYNGHLTSHRKNMTPIIPGVYSIGESNLGKFSREEVTAIRTATKLSTTNNIRTFKKLYFHDTIYYVQQTEDRKRSSSNCCYLVNGTMCYGMIKKFCLSPPLY